MVGDTGADALQGNDGNDLMVGGTAVADLEPVRTNWVAQDFDTASALVPPLLNAAGDGAADGLNGHTGRDLFFMEGRDNFIIRGDDVFIAV